MQDDHDLSGAGWLNAEACISSRLRMLLELPVAARWSVLIETLAHRLGFDSADIGRYASLLLARLASTLDDVVIDGTRFWDDRSPDLARRAVSTLSLDELLDAARELGWAGTLRRGPATLVPAALGEIMAQRLDGRTREMLMRWKRQNAFAPPADDGIVEATPDKASA